MQINNWINYIPSNKAISPLTQKSRNNNRTQQINMYALLEKTAIKFVDEARSKNILLKFESTATNAIVLGHTSELTRIVELLVRNAMTQTLEGFINITLNEEDDHLIILVSDSGLGVHPDQNMQVSLTDFKGRPCRVMHIQDNATKLSHLRDIVAAYNGQLDLKIDPGKGASRKLMLPKVI